MIYDENNRAVISGYINRPPQYSHTLFSEAFYVFELFVPRLSGTEDVLPVTVSERLLPVLPETGDLIEVAGQLRSYNKNVNGRNRLVVTVFARSVALQADDAPCRNEIALTGFICKPPVYRTTPFAREITDLLLAVNRSYHKSDYLPIIAWGRNARYVSAAAVGDCLRVNGRLQSREYQKTMPSGETVTRVAYEVSSSTVEMIEPKLL